jgi:type IV secretory pathway TrbL component
MQRLSRCATTDKRTASGSTSITQGMDKVRYPFNRSPQKQNAVAAVVALRRCPAGAMRLAEGRLDQRGTLAAADEVRCGSFATGMKPAVQPAMSAVP